MWIDDRGSAARAQGSLPRLTSFLQGAPGRELGFEQRPIGESGFLSCPPGIGLSLLLGRSKNGIYLIPFGLAQGLLLGICVVVLALESHETREILDGHVEVISNLPRCLVYVHIILQIVVEPSEVVRR